MGHSAKYTPVWYSNAKARVLVTLELINFWPQHSWIWIRCPGDPEEQESFEFTLQGSARIRCWDDAQLPPGRLGDGICCYLDCEARGDLFRLGPLACLEIGCHKIIGPVADGVMRVEFAMGCWPDKSDIPLPECSIDAYLHSTRGDSIMTVSEDEDSFFGVTEEWLEGRSMPDDCSLGPVLYRSVVDLDLTPW